MNDKMEKVIWVSWGDSKTFEVHFNKAGKMSNLDKCQTVTHLSKQDTIIVIEQGINRAHKPIHITKSYHGWGSYQAPGGACIGAVLQN